MNVEITKHLVKEALAKEPLTQRRWIDHPQAEKQRLGLGLSEIQVSDPGCTVCAVGAVIRNAIEKTAPASTVTRVANWNVGLAVQGNIEELLECGAYLDALSCYFESRRISKPITDKQRAKLIEFVEKNFPEKFVMQIEERFVRKGVTEEDKKVTLAEYLHSPFVDAHLEAARRRELQSEERG